MPGPDPTPASPATEPRRRVSVTWALVLNFGGLLLVAMLAVFGLAFLSASANTIELLRERSRELVIHLATRLGEHLDLPRQQLELMGRMMEAGKAAPERPGELEHYLEGAVSGLPHLRGLSFIDTKLQSLAAQRIEGKTLISRFDWSRDPAVIAAWKELEGRRTAAWSAPLWRPQIQSTIVTISQPVYRNGAPIGALVGIISIEEVSAFVERIGREAGVNAFVLYGTDRVMAHANLRSQIASVSADSPLPALNEVGDAVLSVIWDRNFHRAPLFVTRPPIQNHTIGLAGELYPVFYTEIAGYSDKPLIVGAYVKASEFSATVNRLIWSLVAGVAAIVLAIVLAILIGRRLARPVKRFAQAAGLIGELRVGEVAPLPPSRIREIDDQARAFNAMVRALRWFEAYVPKALARHLLGAGDARSIVSARRNLTVMFTDIVGFSTWSQDQSAADVASFLNHHFGLVIRAIEAEGGTVDKYIGDCVMAFWGAPEKLKQRAERACRAALAIRAAIERDNAERRARGLAPVAMRIGIHSGEATVGNIGAPDRINYTIIGDMVNVGQRIEQLAKEIAPVGAAVAILLSETTRADLGVDFAPRSLGRHALRGREGEVEIYAL
jgi:class 3 adenylate cyclase